MQGAVDGISAGAVSLAGVSQAAPQTVATKRRHERRRFHLHQHHEPDGEFVGRGRGRKRQLRRLHRGKGQTERVDIAASGMTGP